MPFLSQFVLTRLQLYGCIVLHNKIDPTIKHVFIVNCFSVYYTVHIPFHRANSYICAVCCCWDFVVACVKCRISITAWEFGSEMSTATSLCYSISSEIFNYSIFIHIWLFGWSLLPPSIETVISLVFWMWFFYDRTNRCGFTKGFYVCNFVIRANWNLFKCNFERLSRTLTARKMTITFHFHSMSWSQLFIQLAIFPCHLFNRSCAVPLMNQIIPIKWNSP